MKRLAHLLLLIGVIVGLAMQQPAVALAAPMSSMDVVTMSDSDMAAMPDCMAAMQKDAGEKPCKCGMAGCIAMMASGAALMLADGPALIAASNASKRNERIGISPVLRGRSTAPEPEPPSALI